MSVKALLSSIAVATFALLAACGGNDHNDGGNDPVYDWSALSNTLDSYVGSGDGQVTGYSFAMNVGGKLVYQRAGGDLQTISIVPIASASKAPAATVILTLVNEHKIDLDTPIINYIGGDIDWPAGKESITMRMLLNHTSGLPFESDCMNDDSTTLKACAQEIAGETLNFMPGNRFGYSGAGYQVAGYVAEKVSGKSWQTLVKERLSDPLGMPNFSYGDSQNPRIAGGAVATADEYAKFMQLYLNGGKAGNKQIITAAQVAAATTDQVAGLPVYYTPVPDGSGLNGYSFGWWISDAANHPGSVGPEISDPGLLGTTPWMDFDQRYAAALLLISSTDIGIAMWNAARPDILAQLNPPTPAP